MASKTDAWVIKKDGREYCGSSTMETFPSASERKTMISAGYKIYVDGKVFKETKEKKTR